MNFETVILKKFVNVVRVYRAEGERVQIKNRAASALIIPLSGTYIYTQQESLHADPEHFLFVPSGASYAIQCGEGYSLVFNFQAENIPEKLTIFSGISLSEWKEYFAKMAHLKALQPSGYALKALSLLYEIFYRCQQEDTHTDRIADLLAPALTIMQENFSNPEITCRMLAEALNISTVYFRRLFIEKYGVAPARYLKKIRMEYAKMLIQEKTPIHLVAQEAGYCDIYQFSRAYKQYYGHPPSSDAP